MLPVLQFARFMGRAPILEALIAAGPPLDVFDAAMLDQEGRLGELLSGGEPLLALAYSSEGFTPQHLASYYGAPRAAAALLARGADVHARTKNFLDKMAIHAAAAGSAPSEMCALLLDRGADANAPQHGGNTPLHAAGFRGDRALAELLLSHGADAAARNDEEKTPGAVAAGQGHAELATLLDVVARA